MRSGRARQCPETWQVGHVQYESATIDESVLMRQDLGQVGLGIKSLNIYSVA